VGQDLILTAQHCLIDLDLASVRVVFGYYLESSEHLALQRKDVHELISIVSSSEDNLNGVDYAWLRFGGDIAENRAPAPVVSSASPVVEMEPLIAVNSGGGIPLKLDVGGTVVDAREETQDYFVADIDAFRGASGSGVFNADAALVGIVTGGNADFTRAESGCRRTIRLPNEEAKEKIMYVRRAIEGLCAVEPSHLLCDTNCEQPCRDRFTPLDSTGVSCALSRIDGRNSERGRSLFAASVLVAVAAVRRRRRRTGLRLFQLTCAGPPAALSETKWLPAD
jgi:hypothetical protein